ncbi:hypothetical protein KA017_02105 [Candidatus Woesebacteria bacterium]|nr:hypothetical protein [Candidatus Woesebacteria bacterium]
MAPICASRLAVIATPVLYASSRNSTSAKNPIASRKFFISKLFLYSVTLSSSASSFSAFVDIY